MSPDSLPLSRRFLSQVSLACICALTFACNSEYLANSGDPGRGGGKADDPRADDSLFRVEFGGQTALFRDTTQLATWEGNGNSSFGLRLAQRPSSPVTLRLFTSNEEEGRVDSEAIVFSPRNWDTAQLISVASVDDDESDGNVNYIVRADVESDDPIYAGAALPTIHAVNVDDDGLYQVDNSRFCNHPNLSANGRFLAFTCDTPQGVTVRSLHVLDRQTDTIRDIGTPLADGAPIRSFGQIAFTSDGSAIVLSGSPGGTNANNSLHVVDVETGAIAQLDSTIIGDANPVLSPDSGIVAFSARRVQGDVRHLGQIDMSTGERSIVTDASASGRANEGDSRQHSLSADGRYLVFESRNHALDASAPPSVRHQVYRFDRVSGETRRITPDPEVLHIDPDVSDDGRFIAVQAATNQYFIELYDVELGTVELISATLAGEQPKGASLNPAISGDGRFVVYRSTAADLVVGDSGRNARVIVHDRQTGTNHRVPNLDPRANHSRASISRNGRQIAFMSEPLDAGNLFLISVAGATR